jgi:zinc/manganese transport system permease protein
MSWEGLDLAILGPAFAAGIIVLSTHVPMGQAVLRRGIIFIDIAIAQVAGLGVIAANAYGWDDNGWAVQACAVTAAMLGATLLIWTEKRWPDVQEALIGVMFILAATGGILLLANNPHGGEQLKELLVGQILWVSYEQLIPIAILSAVVLTTWFVTRAQNTSPFLFYLLFAMTITASVQVVGVYLVFASLIIPALAARNATAKLRLPLAYFVGISGYGAGLSLSAVLDLPSGAVVVWTLAILGVALSFLWSRKPA